LRSTEVAGAERRESGEERPGPPGGGSVSVWLSLFSLEPSGSLNSLLLGCFSGLRTAVSALLGLSTTCQLYRPSSGFSVSKSKFHRLAASDRAFFSSFRTKRRFSSGSVGPKSARLTLCGLGGGRSSSELELETLRRLWGRDRPMLVILRTVNYDF